MITSLKEDLCHGLLLPLLVMVIINNPTLIDSILEVSEFSQRHVGSITSAGRSDKRTCMMIADIPSRGAIGTTRQWMKKPRSLRISREINVPWTRVHTLGSWGWTYVFPGKSAKEPFLSIPQEMKNCWSLRICPLIDKFRQFFRNLSHRNSRILSTYSWWFVSGSSISNTAQISLVGKLPYDEILAASADPWPEMVNIDGYLMDTN